MTETSRNIFFINNLIFHWILPSWKQVNLDWVKPVKVDLFSSQFYVNFSRLSKWVKKFTQGHSLNESLVAYKMRLNVLFVFIHNYQELSTCRIHSIGSVFIFLYKTYVNFTTKTFLVVLHRLKIKNSFLLSFTLLFFFFRIKITNSRNFSIVRKKKDKPSHERTENNKYTHFILFLLSHCYTLINSISFNINGQMRWWWFELCVCVNISVVVFFLFVFHFHSKTKNRNFIRIVCCVCFVFGYFKTF